MMPCRAWKPSFTGNTWSLLSAIRASWEHSRHRNTHRDKPVSEMDMENLGKLLFVGPYLLLESQRTWGLHWAQGPHQRALGNDELPDPLEQAQRGGTSFSICFNTFLLRSRVKIARWMNIWPGLMYLWIWGQAIGSFFSHSPKFLLATLFKSNRLKLQFKAIVKINSDFVFGQDQWTWNPTFTPNCS
jgi:hypothetical protein